MFRRAANGNAGLVTRKRIVGIKKGEQMQFKPRPWQSPIIGHILNTRRCNIWADMGAGKSAATLSALEILQMVGSSFFPALIIAPLRVARDVWPAESAKWAHLKKFKIVPVLGTAEDRLRSLHTRAEIYSINYENIPWLVEVCGERWPFLTVIADESTKLKNFRLRGGGIRAAALAKVARKAQRWVNLTGTPAPNGLKDLWGQTWFLDEGQRLGKTHTAFKQRWFDTDPYTGEIIPKSYAQEQIQAALNDITLTIQMKDWLDLKEPIFHPVYVTMPAEAKAQYKKLEKEMFVELANEIELTALTAAAKSTKCLQFASGAAYHDGEKWTEVHTAKLDALEEIVEETAGANLLVAYWWKHDLVRIQKRFPYARVLKDQDDIKDWNDGKIPLLLAHPQSAGHGLNLQKGGHHICFFSDWWNLEARLQIIERIGPMRQYQEKLDRPVYIHQIITSGTLDEDVLERHQGKAEVQEILLRAMKRRQE